MKNDNKIKSMSSKNKIIPIIAICLVVVIGMGIAKMIVKNHNKRADAQITTVENREITTAAEGESYTYVADDGNKYLVKDDGMYLMGEDGEYSKLKNMVNIPIFQTFTVTYNNGSSATYTFNKDGTYILNGKYNDGTSYIMNGVYSVTNGIEDSLKALSLKNVTDISALFNLKTENININNIYHVVCNIGETKTYDTSGQEVTDAENEEYDGEYDINTSDIVDEFVFYLYPSDNIIENDKGKYYAINAVAKSLNYQAVYYNSSPDGDLSTEDMVKVVE